jgi:hypothetical protein
MAVWCNVIHSDSRSNDKFASQKDKKNGLKRQHWARISNLGAYLLETSGLLLFEYREVSARMLCNNTASPDWHDS